jgi:hypothetical protein
LTSIDLFTTRSIAMNNRPETVFSHVYIHSTKMIQCYNVFSLIIFKYYNHVSFTERNYIFVHTCIFNICNLAKYVLLMIACLINVSCLLLYSNNNNYVYLTIKTTNQQTIKYSCCYFLSHKNWELWYQSNFRYIRCFIHELNIVKIIF